MQRPLFQDAASPASALAGLGGHPVQQNPQLPARSVDLTGGMPYALQVIGNKKAIGQHYNLCSDRVLTFDGIVRICAEAAGKTPEIVHYEPSSAPKGAFPFRMVHFFSHSDKAKHDLG